MSRYPARAYEGAPDLALLVNFVAAATAARAPGLSYLQPGDVVWQLFDETTPESFENIHLWFDENGLAGYAMFEPPLNVQFDIRADMPFDDPLPALILEWSETRRRAVATPSGDEVPRAYAMLGADSLATVALESDGGRIAFLERNGFRRGERENMRYRQTLEGTLPPAEVPGIRIRHATDADVDERAELHRDAWSVWGPSGSTAARYSRLRHAPLYDESLDIVAEAADGRLVSYCVGWADEANGIGHFEPVGTRPSYARHGLGRAVILEGLRRMQARGLRTALVGTASVNEAAMRLYLACGFELVERELYYVKTVV